MQRDGEGAEPSGSSPMGNFGVTQKASGLGARLSSSLHVRVGTGGQAELAAMGQSQGKKLQLLSNHCCCCSPWPWWHEEGRKRMVGTLHPLPSSFPRGRVHLRDHEWGRNGSWMG